MRVSIEAAGGGQVRVVKQLDLFPITQFEGYNGVGKSTAVRVLQLCTGVLPQGVRARAWKSFVQQMGPVRVLVTGLAGDLEAEWCFDTRKWEDLKAPITSAWFDGITIGGSAATLEEAKALLDVHRLSGDEGVVETLAAELETWRDEVLGARHLVESSGNESSAAADGAGAMAGRLVEIATKVDATVVTEDQRALDLATGEHSREKEGLDKAEDVLKALTTAIEIRDELEQLTTHAPQLNEQIDVATNDIDAAQRKRGELQKELDELQKVAAAGAEAAEELASAERNLDRNLTKLSNASVQLAEETTDLGVEPELPIVEAALAHTRETIDDLVAQQGLADHMPFLRAAGEDVASRLTRAVDEGVGGERILPDDYAQDPSVGALLEAVTARHSELQHRPTNAEYQELQRRIVAESGRLRRLEALPELIKQVARFTRLARQHADTVATLRKSSSLEASARVEELVAERSDVDNSLTSLLTQRARLINTRALLGGGSDKAMLTARLDEKLRECELDDPAGLQDAFGAATERVQSAVNRTTRAATELLDATRAYQEHQEALREATRELASSEEFAWLREGLPGIAPSGHDHPETALARLTEIARRARHAQRRIRDLPNQLIGVEQAFDSVASQLRGRKDDRTQYVPALRRWAEERFTAYFGQEVIKTDLLSPDAENVRVDISEGTVEWTEEGGGKSRPLDAFSSGEQAFLYARARLAALDLEPRFAANRLIFLDEFGAFMSVDRRDHLVKFLKARARDHQADFVVVILPVRSDYLEAADNALGDERDRLTQKAHILATVGAVTEELQ